MIMPVIKKSLRNVESSNTADVLKMSEAKTLPVMAIFANFVVIRCSLQEIGAKAVNRISKFFLLMKDQTDPFLSPGPEWLI